MTSLTGYPSLPIAEQVRRRPIQLQDGYRKVGMAAGIRKPVRDKDPPMLGRFSLRILLRAGKALILLTERGNARRAIR
jgi:hypothetical protein